MEQFANELEQSMGEGRKRQKGEDEEKMPLKMLREGIEMYPHQLRALEWMRGLWPHGGLLADEMGLGKTLEAIGHLCWIAQKNPHPFLVVCPLSVAQNWMAEIDRFSRFHALLLAGTAEERNAAKNAFAQLLNKKIPCVLVTTYEHASKEDVWISRQEWACLVVDEAHRLKNRETVLYKALVDLECSTKLLLTGTPVHNNLDELYNLLYFICPKIFAGKEHLFAAFDERDKKALHSILRIWMLRRLKEDVELGLPKKIELVLKCPMTAMQKKFYKLSLARDYKSLAGGGAASSLSSVLMNLRKASNHPYLFDGAEKPGPDGEYHLGDHLVENSSKLVMLDLLLRKFHREGRKCLIFSTMTRVLDILQDYLAMRGLEHERLDGSVRAVDRNSAIDQFQQQHECFCFLLSTRAGGVGINLTAASVVIFFDSDWNPQADLQAEARCHRIGQTRDVLVVRLLTEKSVDEIMFQRASDKRFLAEAVVNEGRDADLPSMSRAELMEIIQYGLCELEEQEGSGAAPKVTEADLQLMIADAEATYDQSRGAKKGSESALKRSKTIIRREEPALEEPGSMYEFEGTDYGDRNAHALQRIIEEAQTQASSAAPAKRSGTVSAPSVGLSRAEKAEKARLKLEALWEKNGYFSRKLSSPIMGDKDDDDNLVAALNDDDDDDAVGLNHVVGNAAEMSAGGDQKGEKVLLLLVNRSGVFSGGRFFQAVIQAHGPGIEQSYSDARDNKDLHMGDSHLIVSGVQQQAYVCLLVAMDDKGLNMKAFETGLVSLAHWCRSKPPPSVSIHSPHLPKWYSTEKVLRSCLRNLSVFIYYFAKPGAVPSAPLSNFGPLPNFLSNVALYFSPFADAKRESILRRHAIAYGAQVLTAPPSDPKVIVISEKPPDEEEQRNIVLRPTWLEHCFAMGRMTEQNLFEYERRR